MVKEWKKLLQHLLIGVSNLDDLKESLKVVFEREQVVVRGELTASHYVFQTDLQWMWLVRELGAGSRERGARSEEQGKRERGAGIAIRNPKID